MTRFDAMYKIVNFGKSEERRLLADGKTHEAYQIEHARNSLIYFLNENPIKKVIGRIEEMVTYTVDDKGIWHYSKHFVFDDFTRMLLCKLRNSFCIRGWNDGR